MPMAYEGNTNLPDAAVISESRLATAERSYCGLEFWSGHKVSIQSTFPVDNTLIARKYVVARSIPKELP